MKSNSPAKASKLVIPVKDDISKAEPGQDTDSRSTAPSPQSESEPNFQLNVKQVQASVNLI